MAGAAAPRDVALERARSTVMGPQHGPRRDEDEVAALWSWADGHLHPLGFVPWHKVVWQSTHRLTATCIPWDSWHGEGRGSGTVLRATSMPRD